VQWLEEQLRGLGLSDGPAATGLVLGSLCLGQFSLDNNWCVKGLKLPIVSSPATNCIAVYVVRQRNRITLAWWVLFAVMDLTTMWLHRCDCCLNMWLSLFAMRMLIATGTAALWSV
jgi:hypothetical protein